MKELDKHNLEGKRQEIENVIKKNKQQEFKYIGMMKPKRGHSLFEINIHTQEIERVECKINKDLSWDQATGVKRKVKKEVTIKQDCVYISALNKKNALKRYLKLFQDK